MFKNFMMLVLVCLTSVSAFGMTSAQVNQCSPAVNPDYAIVSDKAVDQIPPYSAIAYAHVVDYMSGKLQDSMKDKFSSFNDCDELNNYWTSKQGEIVKVLESMQNFLK